MHLHRSFSCRSYYGRQIIRIYPKASVVTAHITDVLTKKIWSMLWAKCISGHGCNWNLGWKIQICPCWSPKFSPKLLWTHARLRFTANISGVPIFFPAEIFRNRSDVTRVRKSLCKVRRSSLQNLHCNDPTVSNGIQNRIPTTLQRCVREIREIWQTSWIKDDSLVN